MSKCIQCGSYAINPHLHGRDGTDLDLCDVCYWRKRAMITAAVLKEVRKEIKHNAVIVEDPPAFRRGHSLGIKTAVAIIDAKIKELEG